VINARLDALETAQYEIINVFDDTPEQEATGGTKGTQAIGTGSRGVYPRR